MSVEMALVGKSAFECDLCEAASTLRQQPRGVIQSLSAKIFARRTAQEISKCPREMDGVNAQFAAQAAQIDRVGEIIAQVIAGPWQPLRRTARVVFRIQEAHQFPADRFGHQSKSADPSANSRKARRTRV